MIELETERLILRQWRPEDFESYARCYEDEEMARFIGGASSHHQSWRRMASLVGHWVLRGYGYWAVVEKQGGAFAGCVGLWYPEGWPERELGYWLTRETQGKGYATEAGRESIRFAYRVLGVDTLVSYIHPDNHTSKVVAERLGGRFEGTVELLTYGPHEVYRYPDPGA